MTVEHLSSNVNVEAQASHARAIIRAKAYVSRPGRKATRNFRNFVTGGLVATVSGYKTIKLFPLSRKFR
jgi:hypothetical protein